MLNLMPWRNGRLTFLKLLILMFILLSLYSSFTPPPPIPPKKKKKKKNAHKKNTTSSFRHLERGIKDFNTKKCKCDQKIPQSQTADKPMAPRGRPTRPSRDTRKTNQAKQPALSFPSRWLQNTQRMRVVVDGHGFNTVLYFGIKAKQNQEMTPQALHKSTTPVSR